MRYKISSNICIKNAVNMRGVQLSKELKATSYVITDKYEEKDFLINETVKLFLDKFQQPKSFEEVSEDLSKEFNAEKKFIIKGIKPFFDYLLYRDFLVREDKKEKKIILRARFNKGSKVGDYVIEEKIDTQRELDIYKASVIDGGEKVLLKVLKKKDDKYKKRLENEYRLLKQLNGSGVTPNAITLINDEHLFFYVQEFLSGRGISNFIAARKYYSLKDILGVIAAIANSFSKIHKKNIVHGDVHTSNIIITKERQARIIDFGLSIDYKASNHEIVKPGGVYSFMPPERIRTTTYKKFSQKPDMYSDVYQLGIAFYLLVYNEYPYDGVLWEELSKNIKKGKVVFNQKSCYGWVVPEWLKLFIAKCIARKSVERFENAIKLEKGLAKNMKQHGFI